MLSTACAVALLCAQVLGLHFHRHVDGLHHQAVHADHGTHLAGAEHADEAAHDHSHPAEDIDIAVPGAGTAKAQSGLALVPMPAAMPRAVAHAGSSIADWPSQAVPGERDPVWLRPPPQGPPVLSC